MNVFETLFPPRTRLPASQPLLRPQARQWHARTAGRRNRLARFRCEQLEERLALAITVANVERTSAPDFFIDTSLSPDTRDMLANYASFRITNPDPAPVDVWVTATNFSSPKITLADDGIMRVGSVGAGQTAGAFFYFKSTPGEVLALNATYDINVYTIDPSTPGALPVVTKQYGYTNVYETLQTSTNRIDSVTYDNLAPVVGDDITMIVTGRLGNGAQFAEFAPATRLSWPANTFELYKTSISIDSPVPVVNAPDRLFFTGLDGSGTNNQQPFTAKYTFRITASTGGPIVPSPTQFTLADQNWKHHGPEGTIIDVPAVKARLSITKTPATRTVVAGDPTPYPYTITVTNNSTRTAATDVTVVDTWPAGLTIDSILKSQGTVAPPTPTGDFTWTIGTLPASGVATLTASYTVPANAVPKTYVNTATVSSPTDPDSPHTATAETIVTTAATLAITKTDAPDPVTAGGVDYTYTITVTNTGSYDAQSVVVVDDLPTGFVTTGFSGPGTLPVVGTDPFTWTIGTLAKGGVAQLVVTYKVNADVAPGTYRNTATVSSPTDRQGPREAFCDTTVVTSAALTIEKTDAPDPVTAGGVDYTYTITVTNTGPSDAQSVVVVDDLPTGFVTTGFSGPGTLPVVGTDPFTWTIGTLAKGGVAQLVVTYKVNADVAPGTYRNTATVSSPTDRQGPREAFCDTTVVTSAALTIEKTDAPDPVTAGGVDYTYTIRVTNTGFSDAQSVVVVDDLPAGFVTTGFSGPGTLPAVGTDPFTWTIGTLAKGATAQLVVTYKVNADVAPGTYRNTATVSSPTDRQGPREAFCDTTVVTSAALTIEKTDAPDPVTAGGVDYTYTITVTNTGPSDAQSVVVVDDLPTGFVTTGFSGPGTLPVVGTDPFTWTIGTLAKGGVAQLVVTYKVNADVAPGTYRNTATVSSPTDKQGPREAFCDTTVVTSAALTIEKTDAPDPVTAGGVDYTYTITVTNTGPSDAQSVVVVDDLPAGFVTTGFSGPGTLPVVGTDPFTWTIGTLAKGGVAQLVVTYKVNADVAPGTYRNTATVSSPTDRQGPREAFCDTTVVTSAALTIEKTDAPDPVTAGGVDYTYTITVTNTGPSDAQSVVVVDDLPTGFVTTGFSGPGTLPVVGTDPFTWTIGTLAKGGVAQLVVTYKVNADVAPGTYRNTATVSSPTDRQGPREAFCDTTVVTSAALTIEKTAKEPNVTAGQGGYTYTLSVTNTGPSDATNVNVVDTLPGGFTATAFNPAVGVLPVSPTSGPFTWTIGTITAGTTKVVEVTYAVAAGVPAGPATNTADVRIGEQVEGTATATVNVGLVADLEIVKTGDITYKAGGFLAFQVVVTNRGPSFATGVRVVDALPAAVANWSWQVTYVGIGSQTTDGSADSVTASTAGIDKLINLAVSGKATFTITALTQTGFTSDISNTAQATIGGTTVSSTWTSAYDGPINPQADLPGLVLGSDDGCNGEPWVRLVDPETGDITNEFLAYEASFRGSVRVATGDVTGDGIAEIIVGPGRNRIGEIRVFTPQGVELPAFRTLPFGSRYRGGVEVAVGDVDGDGIGDIVAGMSSGIGRVSVFLVTPGAADPVANTAFRTFRGAPGNYRGGVMIAAGDVGAFSGNASRAAADGRAEVIVGLNAGRAALVRVFDLTGSPRVVQTIRPFGGRFSGGVTLSTALYESADVASILVGAGRGGNSLVEVYDGQTGGQVARLQAFSSFAKPNAAVFTAALDLDGDGVVNDVYGVQGRAGGGGTRGVKQFNRATSATTTLTDAAVLVPPLRIAPIVLRVLT